MKDLEEKLELWDCKGKRENKVNLSYYMLLSYYISRDIIYLKNK